MAVTVFYRTMLFLLLAVLAGVLTGYFQPLGLIHVAQVLAELFIKFLKLISLPIVFLAVISTLTSMQNLQETSSLGRRFLKYTFLTTGIAAVVAMILFYWIDPVDPQLSVISNDFAQERQSISVLLLNFFPDNIITAFAEHNVLGVVLIALLIGLAAFYLPKEQQKMVHGLFHSLLNVFMQLAKVIVLILPVVVWAFTVILFQEIQQNSHVLRELVWYSVCILLANLIQGLVVLPIFLKFHNVSSPELVKRVFPALVTAFFTRSSAATLPVTIDCLTREKHVSPKVAQFGIPLCSVINMNGCAAFIFITVHFVMLSNGFTLHWYDSLLWVVVATLAAFGNAAVPMGCFFLASALLAGLNVPLHMMGVILTLYVLFDMVETALNVWSDCSITQVVDRQLSS
ncbi:MAG: cation:dicarboxylase symporter family transporter [Legionellales bacterium]|nr:cation:dicarboxylase symporter family transporter [Legionellales bacterium]